MIGMQLEIIQVKETKMRERERAQNRITEKMNAEYKKENQLVHIE
jgi:hypothetical protein